MESRNYIIILYDFYNTLFSDKQKLYFEEYYFNNLSLGEISDNYSLSRNAIHKMIKSMVEKLEYYEDKLKLYEKSIELTKIIDVLDKDTKEKISKLYLEWSYEENRKLPENPYKEKKEYSYGYASVLYLMSLVVTILSFIVIIMVFIRGK